MLACLHVSMIEMMQIVKCRHINKQHLARRGRRPITQRSVKESAACPCVKQQQQQQHHQQSAAAAAVATAVATAVCGGSLPKDANIMASELYVMTLSRLVAMALNPLSASLACTP